MLSNVGPHFPQIRKIWATCSHRCVRNVHSWQQISSICLRSSRAAACGGGQPAGNFRALLSGHPPPARRVFSRYLCRSEIGQGYAASRIPKSAARRRHTHLPRLCLWIRLSMARASCQVGLRVAVLSEGNCKLIQGRGVNANVTHARLWCGGAILGTSGGPALAGASRRGGRKS